MPRARDILTSARARAVDAWRRVSAEDRQRLRRHAIAIAAAALSTLLAQALGAGPAGSLYFADFVIAVVAWEYGLSSGSVAALTALLTGRVAAVALAGAPMSLWLTAALGAKGLLIAVVAAALAAFRRVDLAELSDLVDRNLSLQAAARRRAAEFSELAATSADEHATLRREADAARLQLTTLQSVTDPALNALDAAELLTTLLERMRVALNADGVALYHFGKPGGRVCSAPSGVLPLGGGARSQPESRGYQTGRTALVHNDAARVVDTSLCQWPASVTSLTAVPIVHGGRLQIVVEVANLRARRSTEWELALIQVVAERVAGLLQHHPYADVA
jgi:hypothetical protein